MCRMYASLGGRGPPVHELAAFRRLATGGLGGPHTDGWGLVGFASPGAPRYLGRQPASAATDARWDAAAQQAADHPVVLGHLRAASSGALTLDNTHPFLGGRWAFAHNGTIRGGYERLGPPGSNDSRALFARVHARLGQGDDPLEALRAAVREVRDGKYPYTSLTMLLTDGGKLWGAREAREREDVSTLRWAEPDGRLVVCQEPIVPAAWREVPNGHAMVAGARGVEVSPL